MSVCRLRKTLNPFRIRSVGMYKKYGRREYPYGKTEYVCVVVLARQYCEIKYSMLKYRYATIKTRQEKIAPRQEKNTEK